MKSLPLISFLLFLFISVISCRKDNQSVPLAIENANYNDSIRNKFVGDWRFWFKHVYDGIYNDTSYYLYEVDTVWVKEGSIQKQANSYSGLVVNYGAGESDFTITTNGLEVNCIESCENAGYDTLASFAYWWYLAEGSWPYDSSAIYNLGFYAYYGSADRWQIIGYPK